MFEDVLAGRILLVENGSIVLLELYTDPTAELEFSASLSRVLLVLQDRGET